MGHYGKESIIKTSHDLNLDIKDKPTGCEYCALRKSRCNNLNQVNENKSTIPGKMIYIDLRWKNRTSQGGSRYCLLIIDECMKMFWREIIKENSYVKEHTKSILDHIRN